MKKLSNACGVSFFVTLLLSLLSIGSGFIYCFFTEKSVSFPFDVIEFITEEAENGGHYTSIQFSNNLFVIIAAMFIILAVAILLFQILFEKNKKDESK